MAVKPLTRVQKEWIAALKQGGHVTGMRSNTNSTGMALFRRGLAHFNYSYDRWQLTPEGEEYAKHQS